MAKQATGIKPKLTASSSTPSGSRPGMSVGPSKPSAGLANVARPVIAKGPVAGVKTNRKAQPMYTKMPSKAGRMVDQYGTGIADSGGKAYKDSASARTKPVKQQLNQG